MRVRDVQDGVAACQCLMFLMLIHPTPPHPNVGLRRPSPNPPHPTPNGVSGNLLGVPIHWAFRFFPVALGTKKMARTLGPRGPDLLHFLRPQRH